MMQVWSILRDERVLRDRLKRKVRKARINHGVVLDFRRFVTVTLHLTTTRKRLHLHQPFWLA